MDEEEVEELDAVYSGKYNKANQYHGRGTLYFQSDKSERFEGRFFNGVKEGKGTFYFGDGSSLSGLFKNDCLLGQGVYTYPDGSITVGTYKDGVLDGYCQEYDHTNKLTFCGYYSNNVRFGICQFYIEFGGTLFGLVDRCGRLTGKGIVYSYPDNETFLKGFFQNGELVKAYPAVYDGLGCKENPYSYKIIKSELPVMRDISTSNVISKYKLQKDIFERKRVEVKPSLVEHAGEGLFSRVHAGPGEVMSFYNGVRKTHHVVDSRDWKYNGNTISLDGNTVIDVPKPWSEVSNYNATLGHKANHSFAPNCMYDRFNHPRFGAIKCIRTIAAVHPGEELLVAYGYDHSKLETDAPDWYRWQLLQISNNNTFVL